MRGLLLAALLALAGCGGQQGAAGTSGACTSDPAHWARGAGGCLAMEAYGPASAEVLVVVLHGDLSSGGPARYHRAMAQRIATALPGAAAVALVRPGYPDGAGRTSDGNADGRSDHYTRANIALVGEAVADLRKRTGARRVVAVGHSGGATTAADLLALAPGTIDAAVLLACPCDIVSWRGARRPWTASVSPIAVADQVPRTARVAAFTGSADTNTSPALARSYVDRLAARGVDATFMLVPGATHDGVVDAAWASGLDVALTRLAGP